MKQKNVVTSKEDLIGEIIRDQEGFFKLREEWRDLLAGSEYSSVFLSWEWMSAWLQTVFPTADLYIIIVRSRDGTLLGIAPFYIAQFTLLFCLHYKVLRFLGDSQSGAEYPDIIIRKGFTSVVLKTMAQMVEETNSEWHCGWFSDIAAWEGSSQRILGCFSKTDLGFSRKFNRLFGNVVLPQSWDEYSKKLTASQRKILKRQVKKVNKSFSLNFVKCSEKEDVMSFLEQLFRLHGYRWQMIGQSGSFLRRPKMKDFYETMAFYALERGWLGLFNLELDGEVVASQYGYVYNGVFYQLQEGFDPDGPPGTGNILRQYVIRWCIENSLEHYDFLGGFTRHKKHWGAQRRAGFHIFLGKACLRNIVFAILPLSPTGRYIDQGPPATYGRSHDD